MKKIILFIMAFLELGLSGWSQEVGIGTSTPTARLEIKGEGNNSLTNNLLLRNSDGDILLRMRNDGRMTLGYNGFTVGRTLNIGGNGANFYLTDAIFSGAIFPEDTALVIWSEVGDDKFVLLQPSWGKVGIGTYEPKAKLHVRTQDSGATPFASATAIFEDNTDVSINLLAPSTESSAIYFGKPNNSIHGGIVYNSTVINGLAFNTNGNVTRAVINNVGDMGIGETSPIARLHVSDGPGGEVYFSGAEVIIEDNSASYLQFSTPNGSEAGILSGNDESSIRSALIFRQDSTIQLRTGGNTPRMAIDKAGNIGIGTVTPTQKLHVVGNGLFEGIVIASCGVLSCSDIRYKNRLSPLTNTLTSLMSLHGIYYYWDKEKFTDKTFNDSRQIGFSAQEVELVFPEMVFTDVNGYKLVDYSRLTPVLVEAIKEQQDIISAQQSRLDAMEQEMLELKSIVLQLSNSR